MFRMDLGSAECGGHAVVALRGELDLLYAPAAATALEAIAARQPRIILDLAGLEFIDVSGIGALERGRGLARDAGGDLLLAAPQRQVRRVLTIIGRHADGFAIHASVAAAAASAGASRPVVALPQPAWMRWQRIAAASAGHSAATGAAAAEVAGHTEDADDDRGDQDESQNDHDVPHRVGRPAASGSFGTRPGAFTFEANAPVPGGKQPIREGLITVADYPALDPASAGVGAATEARRLFDIVRGTLG